MKGRDRGRRAERGAELLPSHSPNPGSHPGDPRHWGGDAAPSLVGTMLVRVTSSGLRPPFSFRLIVLCVSQDHSCGGSVQGQAGLQALVAARTTQTTLISFVPSPSLPPEVQAEASGSPPHLPAPACLEHVPQTGASSWPCPARGCCATTADPPCRWLPRCPDAGLGGVCGTCAPGTTLRLGSPAPLHTPISFSPARAQGRWRRPGITQISMPTLQAVPLTAGEVEVLV